MHSEPRRVSSVRGPLLFIAAVFAVGVLGLRAYRGCQRSAREEAKRSAEEDEMRAMLEPPALTRAQLPGMSLLLFPAGRVEGDHHQGTATARAAGIQCEIAWETAPPLDADGFRERADHLATQLAGYHRPLTIDGRRVTALDGKPGLTAEMRGEDRYLDERAPDELVWYTAGECAGRRVEILVVGRSPNVPEAGDQIAASFRCTPE